MMVRPKRGEQPPLTPQQIKSAARKQMAASGTAGLSLRGIARELEVTAPAIYNYFPRLDDLITALIVDAFTAQAVAMETARDEANHAPNPQKILAMVYAYRRWALEHPVDFQLIYGNPIPGYQAPAELTSPLAFRPFRGLFELFVVELNSGRMTLPEAYGEVPASISGYLKGWKQNAGIEIPDALVCILMSGWARIHGMVMLELFHHLGPVIGDPKALYQYEMHSFLRQLEMKI